MSIMTMIPKLCQCGAPATVEDTAAARNSTAPYWCETHWYRLSEAEKSTKRSTPIPRNQFVSPWDNVIAEVTAEMIRTVENSGNNESPTFNDYAADIVRRLTFIIEGEEI